MESAQSSCYVCNGEGGVVVACRRCNAENPDGARFCDACGAALDLSCTACGAINRSSARFCGHCGAPLAGTDARTSTAAWAGREEISASEMALSLGERKDVTVLFADVRGSTQLIEALDPEAAMHQLDPAVQAMADAVVRSGGVVNRTQGDGIMALFGVPSACEDHAVRACLAARAMIDAVAALGDENIAIRVGLDSGEVVVRPTGRDESDYDATGVVTHVAHRMEQHATPGTVLLTGRTARLARGYVDLALRGPMAVKGISEPIETFRLISATARPTWEVRSSMHRLNRFVGRATELAQLSAALARAELGRGQVVTIIADAGFGKSRLVHEFLGTLPTATWNVLRVAAMSQAVGAPYSLAAELLRSLLGVGAADDRAEIARKLDQTLAIMAGYARPDLAPLKSLLDLPVDDDEEWLRLDPPERRNRLIAAVRAIVLREATLRPLVLFTDDYHWVDQSSAEVLGAIVDGLGAARLLMLVTTRPDRRPHWGARSYSLELQLAALEPESAETLLRELIDASAGLDSLRQQISVQAGGVPLYIEELARSLSESGAVITDAARLNATKRLDATDVPASIKAIIAARIDRLPHARRRLLQIASVIGSNVPLKLLQAVADSADGQLESELTELQRAEFLYEVHMPSGTEYTFRHGLIQTVAYEEMLRKHRRDLHARVLAAMENVFADRREEMTERFADHAMRGEAWDAAASYALKAGDRAIARWSWREAIGFFETAIQAVAHVPESPEKTKRSIEARLRLRVALPAAADLPGVVRCLDEARNLASATGDGIRLAEIDLHRCLGLTKMGLLDQAAEAGQRGYAAARDAGESGFLVNASFALAQAYWYQGQFRQSEKLLADCLKDVQGQLRIANTGTTGTVSVLHLVCVAKTHAITGEFAKALAASGEAKRIAEETRKPFDLSYAGVGAGFCLLLHEEPLAAVEELEEALRLARTGDIALLIPSAMRYLGPAYAMSGRLVDANDLLHEAIDRTTAHGLLGMRIWSSAALASVQMLSSALTKARETSLSTLELAGQYGFRPVEAQLMRLIGNLHERSRDDHADEAEQWYRRAILLSDELGMRPEAAQSRRDLARFLRRCGRSEEAGLQEAAAQDLRRAMGLIGQVRHEERAKLLAS
jgi:class 3 adenylate cyclase/tetratricopeptide (TPR) repeat protein